MPETRWFMFHGKVHAVDPPKAHLTARCGVRPLAEPKVRTLADGDYPPEDIVCQKCRIEVGLDDLEVEPLESVRARGYLPSSITSL